MSEYYAVQRSGASLQHYGVKGMRWGVRKAISTGNSRALDRHFRKAAKKLAKLQDIGFNSKKYAAKASAYGAAAVGTGTIAIGGPARAVGVLEKISKKHGDLAKQLESGGYTHIPAEQAKKHKAISERAKKRADALKTWSESQSSIFKPRDIVKFDDKTNTYSFERTAGLKKGQVLRIGSGLAALGFAAKAGQNAYRAANGKRYRAKALNFKNEMDQAFAGTKYEGKYVALPKRSKKRR